jgi:tight adherence protein B
VVTGVVAALLAGYGAFLLYTAVVCGWRGVGPRPVAGVRSSRRPLRAHLDAAGLRGVRPAELVAAVVALAVVGGTLAFALFGGVAPAVVAAGFAASLPFAAFRSRHRRRLAAAQDAWPRLLEELRLLTGSVGRSIPQALFDVGRRAPVELRPAFADAEREWMLTMDFDRTVSVLKAELADPTADVVCETLVVAHEVGGGGLDRRLAALVEDRLLDSQGRKDAASKQAGVVFARRFVLIVPLGMAVAGLSIGTGRAAYETASGQLAVVVGLAAVVACWIWSGRLMRVPGEPRVFATPAPGLDDRGGPDRIDGQHRRRRPTAGPPVTPTPVPGTGWAAAEVGR